MGWPDLPWIEALRGAWREAPDEGRRKTIARNLEALTMREIAFRPLRQDPSRTACRDDLRDVVKTVSVFRNVRQHPEDRPDGI